MTTTLATPQAESTIRNWISTTLHNELTALDVIQEIAFNFPSGLGNASASGIRSIRSIKLNELQLLSLSFSKIIATLEIKASVSVTVSWDDYLASQEVRDLVGESEEFVSTYIDTEIGLEIQIEFQLISEPPLVASHKFLSIAGDCGSHTFS